MVCFGAPLMKILAFSETLGYISMALLAVEILFSVHISLTLDTELVDGASELFWLFEYVGRLDFRAASFAFSGLSYSLWHNACSKLWYSAYFLKLISVASFLSNEWSTTCTHTVQKLLNSWRKKIAHKSDAYGQKAQCLSFPKWYIMKSSVQPFLRKSKNKIFLLNKKFFY